MVNTPGPWPDPRLRALAAHWDFQSLPWRVQWRRWICSESPSTWASISHQGLQTPEPQPQSSVNQNFISGQALPRASPDADEASRTFKRRRLSDANSAPHPLEAICNARNAWQGEALFGTVENGNEGELAWWDFLIEGQPRGGRIWQGLSCAYVRLASLNL
jgi:hypothetical protein